MICIYINNKITLSCIYSKMLNIECLNITYSNGLVLYTNILIYKPYTIFLYISTIKLFTLQMRKMQKYVYVSLVKNYHSNRFISH